MSTTKTLGPIPSMIGKIVARFGWGLADQMLSSLTNFILGLLAARLLAPSEFGALGVVFAVYTLVLTGSRRIAADALVIRFSAVTLEEWRGGVRSASGTAVLIGGMTGIGCIAVSQMTGGALSSALMGLALTMPGLLLQDAWRFAFFAAKRGSAAFLNDLVWATTLLAAVAVILIRHVSSVEWLVLAWGGAGSIAAMFGLVQTSVLPAPRRAASWFRDHRDLILPYLAESAVTSIGTQLTVFGVGALAGLAAVGALNAGQLLLGPLNVLFLSMGLVAVPEGARALRTSVARLRRLCILIGAGLGTPALVIGVVAWLLPQQLGIAILRQNWGPAHGVVLPLSMSLAGSGIVWGAAIGLRALAAARRSLRVRLLVAPLSLAGGLTGAVLWGARGAAWGLAIAVSGSAIIWWRSFLLGLAEYARGRTESATTTDQGLPPGAHRAEMDMLGVDPPA